MFAGSISQKTAFLELNTRPLYTAASIPRFSWHCSQKGWNQLEVNLLRAAVWGDFSLGVHWHYPTSQAARTIDCHRISMAGLTRPFTCMPVGSSLPSRNHHTPAQGLTSQLAPFAWAFSRRHGSKFVRPRQQTFADDLNFRSQKDQTQPSRCRFPSFFCQTFVTQFLPSQLISWRFGFQWPAQTNQWRNGSLGMMVATSPRSCWAEWNEKDGRERGEKQDGGGGEGEKSLD